MLVTLSPNADAISSRVGGGQPKSWRRIARQRCPSAVLAVPFVRDLTPVNLANQHRPVKMANG